MAKLINPLLSQDARGSLAGVQYSRNRAGCFGSRKSTTSHKATAPVLLHRSRLKLAHSAWDSLSSSLKSNWDTFAPATQTGRNAFIGAALTNFTVNQAAPTLSPLSRIVTPIPYDFWYDAWEGFCVGHALQFTSTMFDPRYLIIYLRTQSPPRTVHRRKYKYFAHGIAWPAPICLPIPFPGQYVAIRVVLWDYLRGRSIAEWQDFFDPTVDKGLFGYQL